MKYCTTSNVASLLVCSALVSVQAYPGAQQARSIPPSTTRALTSNSSSTGIQETMTVLSSLLPTQTSLPSTSSSKAMPESGTYRPPTLSVKTDLLIEKAHGPLHSSLLGLLGDELGIHDDSGDEDDQDCEEEDNDDEDDDDDDDDNFEQQSRTFQRREEESLSGGTLHAILINVEQINESVRVLVSALPRAVPKRQLDDVLDQEQSYGNRGKDLTQEQRASLDALVKGVNGYQASLDGATNTGQAESETSQVIQSSPLSSATPTQMAELLALLKAMEEQQRSKKPSTTSLGSQAGQTASQASWMVPEESTIHEAGSTANSNAAMVKDTAMTAPDSQSLVLFARLEELRKQEQELLVQIQGQQTSSPKGQYNNRHKYQAQGEPEQQGLHNLSEEDLDDVTAMVLEEEARSRTAAATTNATNAFQAAATPPTGTSSRSTFPTASAVHRRQAQSVHKQIDTDKTETEMATKLLEMGGFDSAKLAAALSIPTDPINTDLPSSPLKTILSLLLNDLDPSIRRQVLEQFHQQHPKQ